MRYKEFRLVEAQQGREYNHLEDLVFFDGAAGAMKAADTLDQLGKGQGKVAIKWDGNPTVYFGREPDGTFVLTGKNGWGKNMSTDANDLAQFIMNTGKGAEQEPWRKDFAAEMSDLFKIIEAGFPKDFEGYVYGDLLYTPRKPATKGRAGIEFTPNKVTYSVDPNSEIGKRIANSKVGVALHGKYDSFGAKVGQPLDDVKGIQTNDLVAFAQTYVPHTPKVDTKETNEIRQMAKANAKFIDSFLEPQQGLSDLKNIIYTFSNQTVKAQKLDQINVDGFFNWLKTSKVSQPKQVKIYEKHKQSPKSLPAIFALLNKVAAVKNHIIDQLDDAPADIKQMTGAEKGGEGYVTGKVKLVPRHRWRPD